MSPGGAAPGDGPRPGPRDAQAAKTRYKSAVSRRWTPFIAIAAVVIVADQLTKVWARSALPTDGHGRGERVPVIENFFDWQLAFNTGSAFSLFAGTGGARVFLSLAAVAAVAFIVWLVRSTPEMRPSGLVGLALVAGGAIGNLIDRAAFGKVTDFVLWRYHDHTWPIFNVADAALTVGVALFLIASWRMSRDEKRASAQGASKAATESG